MIITKTETVEYLKKLFSQLLKADLDTIGEEDILIEIGVDSLIIVEAIRRIEKQYGIPLKVRQLFEDLSTINEIAEYIDSQNIPQEMGKEEIVTTLKEYVSHLLKLPLDNINI